MDKLEELRSGRTVIGVMWFLGATIILTLIDILCVGAYFAVILCLVYLTFMKDCFEILIYAIIKFITRLKWIYEVFKIREFLYMRTETRELQSSISVHLHSAASALTNSCPVEHSSDLVASASICSKSTQHPLLVNTSQSGGYSLPSDVEGLNRSTALFQSPLTGKSGSEERVPRKLSSLSTCVISSTENCNIDETNFEDVDLYDENHETVPETPTEEPSFRNSKWNVSNMKFLDSFRKNKLSSPISVKMQLGNIATRISRALPGRSDDKEKLVNDKNDSPEQVGCCTSLPHLFKMKYQSSTASYGQM